MKQSIKLQASSNLADEPSSADAPPPGTRAEMTWQMRLLLPMAPPWYQGRDDLLVSCRKDLWEARVKPEMSSNLADEPSSANGPPGRQTFCQWIPHLLARLVLGRQTFFGWWTPCTRAEMPWIPVHKTWQMNLCWPMDPPVPEQRCLAYQ